MNGNEQREALAKVIRLFSVEPSRASGEGGMASNESTAHMLITSQLLGVKDYRLTVPDAHAWRPAA